jgi:DHA2 family multidrug resistance protein
MLFFLRAAPILLVTPILVRITGKVDPRILLGLGFVFIALGSYLQANVTVLQAGFWTFAIPLVVTGLGAALLFIPLSIAVLGAVSPAEGPKASAFVNLSTQLGGSIAVAGLDVLIDQRMTFHSARYGALANGASVPVQNFLHVGSLGQLAQVIDVQALIASYADATLAIALMCIACAPLVLFMRKPQKPAGPVEVGG